MLPDCMYLVTYNLVIPNMLYHRLATIIAFNRYLEVTVTILRVIFLISCEYEEHFCYSIKAILKY